MVENYLIAITVLFRENYMAMRPLTKIIIKLQIFVNKRKNFDIQTNGDYLEKVSKGTGNQSDCTKLKGKERYVILHNDIPT